MSHKVVYDEKINGLLYLTGLTRTYFGQTLGLIRMRFSVNNFLSVCQQVPSMAHRTRGEDRATHGATSVTFLPSAFSHFTVVQSPLGLSAPSPCLDSTPHEPFLWRCLLWRGWGVGVGWRTGQGCLCLHRLFSRLNLFYHKLLSWEGRTLSSVFFGHQTPG